MELSRRRLLSTCASAVGGLACGRLYASSTLHSFDGLLDAFIDARLTAGVIGGRGVQYWGYNGELPGTTFETRPGDTLRVHLRNGLPEATNLHFHGLHVSPSGNADNSFIMVPPGEQFDYEIQIPNDHLSGTFWYHPHVHGVAARQVFHGLAGLLIVRGDLDAIPEIAAAQEQVLVLQDFTFDRSGQISEPSFGQRMQGREGDTLTVNGEVTPTFSIQRNGLLRCRFLNASCSRYYQLSVEEHPMAVVAADGGPLRTPHWTDKWLLAPGQRVDLLIRGERPAGSYRILSLPYDRGSVGMMGVSPQSPLVLAYLNYSGTAERAVPVPEKLLNVEALPAAALQRRFVLTEGMMGSFQINGRTFRPDRTDTVVELGSTEDWEIENRGGMDHPFHMHVNPFQLVGADGLADSAFLDVINIPRASRRRIRVRFNDFPGLTLYHCHILDHEDLGMMGILEIRR